MAQPCLRDVLCDLRADVVARHALLTQERWRRDEYCQPQQKQQDDANRQRGALLPERGVRGHVQSHGSHHRNGLRMWIAWSKRRAIALSLTKARRKVRSI